MSKTPIMHSTSYFVYNNEYRIDFGEPNQEYIPELISILVGRAIITQKQWETTINKIKIIAIPQSSIQYLVEKYNCDYVEHMQEERNRMLKNRDMDMLDFISKIPVVEQCIDNLIKKRHEITPEHKKILDEDVHVIAHMMLYNGQLQKYMNFTNKKYEELSLDEKIWLMELTMFSQRNPPNK